MKLQFELNDTDRELLRLLQEPNIEVTLKEFDCKFDIEVKKPCKTLAQQFKEDPVDCIFKMAKESPLNRELKYLLISEDCEDALKTKLNAIYRLPTETRTHLNGYILALEIIIVSNKKDFVQVL